MNQIILALDVPPDRALELVRCFTENKLVNMFKIGYQLFTLTGPEFIEKLGVPIFLDLKFHDIPNTVYQTVLGLSPKIKMFTIHASGGKEMCKAAVKAAGELKSKPLVLAVTVLSSLDEQDIEMIGINTDKLADIAVESGVDGLICAQHDIARLRARFKNLLLVSPGIRVNSGNHQDQKRTFTAKQAIDSGANMIVIGRPITASNDPIIAALEVLKTL